ncbi:MAG: hypothetical protein HYU69_05435 [Bacteroidetes bacterium]|nr:hypothetical protein [Bacteroidota bacterium]
MNYFKPLTTIAFSLFCAASQFVYSQKVQQNYFTVYINDSENNCTIKAEVCNKKSKIRYSDTLKYYWYGTNKIIITQGASDGKILHGKYSTFYYNNNLKEQGFFKKGMQNGQWKKWNSTGIIQDISNWHKGYRQGKQILFDSAGNKASELSYKKGKLHGPFVIYIKGKVASKKHFQKGVELLPGDEKIANRVKHKLQSFFGKMNSSLKRKSSKVSTGPDNTIEKEAGSDKKQDKKNEVSRQKKEKKADKATELSPQTKPGTPMPPARSEK